MPRVLKFNEAVLEATRQVMAEDQRVTLMGLGVTDPLGVFGTTKGLMTEYPDRVIETPTAENAMMGVAIGTALVGMRPIITHQRVEFSLLAFEQIVNQAAKWHYMTGGLACIPLLVRLIVGRGWGQGPQHSQSLDPLFAHIPGLKVITPSSAFDAKGLLIASVRDNNPVIMIEHRWLHDTVSEVPVEPYEVDIGTAKIVKKGKDVTIVSYSYMLSEVLFASEALEKIGISVEVVDIRSFRPLDIETVKTSIKKTGRIITVDSGWVQYGIGSEILASLLGYDFSIFKASPIRLGVEDVPIPSSRALANSAYPGQKSIVGAVAKQLGCDLGEYIESLPDVFDTPNPIFKGPF